MRIFFDASTLVKAYIDEDGSDFVEEVLALSPHQHQFIVSSHVEPETVSAFAKKWRRQEVTKSGFQEAVRTFYQDYPKGFYVVSLHASVLRRAARLIQRLGERHIKAGDAMQIAACIYADAQIGGSGDGPTRFLVADGRLADRAREAGLWVLDPTSATMKDLRGQYDLFADS